MRARAGLSGKEQSSHNHRNEANKLLYYLRRSRKTSTSALLTMPKPLTMWITTNCGTTDWFQIGKGVCQGCILSPCLLKLYAEYIMRNARLDEAQAWITNARRNINNLRYADDTTLWQIVKGNLNESLDEVERGEWKSWLKIQHSEN